jgi:dsRNA-specific ribonuclease
LLEFLGDSILNFIVLDFFYKNSRNFPEKYSPNILHKLKTELVNNNFLSLIVIEKDIHNTILIKENEVLKNNYDNYVQQIINDAQGDSST